MVADLAHKSEIAVSKFGLSCANRKAMASRVQVMADDVARSWPHNGSHQRGGFVLEMEEKDSQEVAIGATLKKVSHVVRFR